jgi:hypothetical protein
MKNTRLGIDGRQHGLVLQWLAKANLPCTFLIKVADEAMWNTRLERRVKQ